MITHHRKIMLEVTGEKSELHINGWVPLTEPSTLVRLVAVKGTVTWVPLMEPSTVVRVVAVKGTVDDWAAYVAPAYFTAETVIENGMKLSEDEAARIFPVLNAARYRR
ncbi:MAG: hypothetical protein L0214_07640 [candidate division NC10 bacterium]|nr:hypothetical protein [candidate division NC10 bacterium]